MTTTPPDLAAALRDACRGEVREGMHLRELSTLRVGGPATAVVTPADDADLAAVGEVARTHGAPWLVAGRGSNLLVGDAGWPGIVITLGPAHRGIDIADGQVVLGAAEPLPTVAVAVADAGLTGFAWACAVPGSVGGAVVMNAGAHGGEMADHLVEVDLIRLHSGSRETWPVHLLDLAYRHSDLPDDAVVVGATLALEPGDPDEVRAEIRGIRQWRRDHQPLRHPNCGSVFTNPPGDSAGRLVDSAGGKDIVVGGARVSELHANFIVTRPGARAEDVLAVIDQVRARVREVHGVDLVPEVQVRGVAGWGGWHA